MLPILREALVQLQPDIVFLQEVVGEHARHAERFDEWPIIPQCEFLAAGIWPHSAYGKNAVHVHGHHGNAILSKYPIVQWSNTDISTNNFETRGILHAEIEVPGIRVPLHCLCVHLNILRRGQKRQLASICERVGDGVPAGHPLLLAGDFNDWSQGASRLLFDQLELTEVFLDLHGRHALTFPTRFPLLSLDRVYSRGLENLGGSVLTEIPWRALSDHAALYVEVVVPSPLRFGDG